MRPPPANGGLKCENLAYFGIPTLNLYTYTTVCTGDKTKHVDVTCSFLYSPFFLIQTNQRSSIFLLSFTFFLFKIRNNILIETFGLHALLQTNQFHSQNWLRDSIFRKPLLLNTKPRKREDMTSPWRHL